MLNNNCHWQQSPKWMLSAILIFALSACAHQPFPALEVVRNDLLQLKGNEIIAGKAPVALYDAEKALKLADEAWQVRSNQAETEYLTYLVKRKIEIAKYTAQRKMCDDELTQLKSDREHLLLDSKEAEIKQALSKVKVMEEKLRQMEVEQFAKTLNDQNQMELDIQKKSLAEPLQELK
jgi:hypothetical protein